MAHFLTQTQDLLVLRVERIDPGAADAREPGLSLRCTLLGKVGGRRVPSRTWAVSGAFDAAQQLLRGDGREGERQPMELPAALGEGLRSGVQTLRGEGRPLELWLHLHKPYGALRFVPWERLLVPLLGMPILMLPDFVFPHPREALWCLDVAICASAPCDQDAAAVSRALTAAVDAYLDGSPRRTRVHVFCDRTLFDEHRRSWAGRSEVTLYDPREAGPFVGDDLGSRVVDEGGLLRSPWLLWMRAELRRRAIDVVHFCCPGRLSRGRGALLLAQSPLERTDRYLSGPVGATELGNFLTQVGAWSTAFSVPPYSRSPFGLRALADEIAQCRPGPLLLHDVDEDPSGRDLLQTVPFLYGTRAGRPPVSPALLLYCQPYLVGDRRVAGPARATRPSLPGMIHNRLQSAAVRASVQDTAMDPMLWQVGEVPAWLAATRNFVDGKLLHLQALARDEVLPRSILRDQSAVVRDTLELVSAAAAALARERGLNAGVTEGARAQAIDTDVPRPDVLGGASQ